MKVFLRKRLSLTTQIIVVVFVSIVLSGCMTTDQMSSGGFGAVVPARLYEMSSGEVIPANFSFLGTTRGSIDFSFPSGERFVGEYNTVRGGSNGWGSVYSLGVGGSSSFRYSVRPTEYTGTAIASSALGRTIICEYITNTSMFSPHGQGVCRDNRGSLYKLMF